MKLAFNLLLFLFALVLLEDKSFSLTHSQIKNVCKKEKRQSTCVKNLLQKKINLKEGNLIEIPVIPYKR